MTFPTDLSFNTIPQITDGVDYPEAADINPVYDEIIAIEKLLGVNGGSWIGEGQMMNGKLSVTVSANDLIVALKTIAGTDPSTTDPVYIRINGTVRKCTAALSKTLVDGTNWFNSGGAELATKEADYFVYAIWNTTPATDIMDLGFSRAPYFSVYSEASGTTTNEKYLAFANASTPTSTDNLVNIGRFAATLSAGAGYTWTVPTFTTANLIQRPIFFTRWLSYAPTVAGFSAVPTATVYEYKLNNTDVTVRLREATAGTSNSTSFSYTAPFTAKTVTNGTWANYFLAKDNSAFLSTPSYIVITSASASLACTLTGASAGTSWTNSGTKQCFFAELNYPIN